ncbi:F-box/FBD/LRR-repeat protein At5g44980-like [Impatiens glandulifera]|uniref:F-box/FBD/LRR-repeat protein At5g44980-like n=1 Tax=Impatiens glandulifera TaxID=253017 RepID=UPI001FB14B29|nr:F-box/FBD/LRR-repeat protein At5g44980-like [Impatiens glandulifera]
MRRKRRDLNLLRENKDLLSDLPDDLLDVIICKLDMKDAVKTGSLSKRWRHVWTNYVVDLKFNHVNILGLKSKPRKKKLAGLDTVFVDRVDNIMKLRCEGNREKINSFCLQFPLGKRFSPLIDKWLNFAIGNRVETIDLDLSSNLPSSARYNFSLLRTVSNYEKKTLKHLRLTNCNFRGWSSSPKFGLLISLQLETVIISSLQLAKVLESCPLLEDLTLDTCCNLTELTINATLLKHLSLTNCCKLKEIDVIRAQNLVYIQLAGVLINSLQLRRLIECCPLLEELTLKRCHRLTYLRIGDSNNCTLLKHLSLTRCSRLMEIDVIRAPNLISLKLKGVSISNLQLTNIIESCPLLEELTLLFCNLLTYLRILESNNSRLKSLHLDRCSNLKEIDICANLLHTLEYNGISQWFSFKKSPRLVNVFIGKDIHLLNGDPLRINTLARDIPSIENLIFAPHHSLEFFHINDPEPVFYMRRLVLNVVMRNRKEELLWVKSILNDFPILETLELNFMIKSRKEMNEKATFDRCRNKRITKLEVNGFEGNQHQVDLLEFLLENLVGLRILAIGPCRKTYISFNSWVYGKANDKGKKWFEDRSEWLRTIISPLVHLEFLRIES